MANQPELENLLSAVTDALLEDERADMDKIVRRYDVPRTEVDDFVRIIQRLHVTLVGARPSRQFVRRLRMDLVGSRQPNPIVSQVRRLPVRVQIAAGIALVLGFIFINRRRLVDASRREAHEVEEVPALQQ
jgi:type VI protein secretion system component VasF